MRRMPSDHGGASRSYLWRDTFTELGITPEHPPIPAQTTGSIERFRRALADGWAFMRF